MEVRRSTTTWKVEKNGIGGTGARVAWCLGTYASRGARAVPVGSASRVLRERAVTIVLS